MNTFFNIFVRLTFGWFPLTPVLSRWERENRIRSLNKSSDGICRTRVQKTEKSRLLSPLLGGEGQGGGKSSTNHCGWLQIKSAMKICATP